MTNMMMLAITAGATFFLFSSPAPAQNGRIGLTEAVSVAERANGGHVLDAEVDRRGGRLIYDIELVKDGQLQELVIDGGTGRVVRRATPLVENQWARWFEADRLVQVTRSGRLSQILARLERETGGEVIDASFDVEAGRLRYELEVASRAGVTDVDLDAVTGERLSMTLDD